jgi:hypothetical protein
MGDKEVKPGDGIRSMKTSNVFRVVNFELYSTPVRLASFFFVSAFDGTSDVVLVSDFNFFFQNKTIMALGAFAILGCTGYIMYMRKSYEGRGYYAAIDQEGEEYYVKKESKWD